MICVYAIPENLRGDNYNHNAIYYIIKVYLLLRDNINGFYSQS